MLISVEKSILKSFFIFLLVSILFNSFGKEIKIDEVTSAELKRFETACKNGNADGCNTAASILFSFEMYKDAFYLFKKGCDDLNNAISCYNVGDFFFNGYGDVSKNESKAIKYWKKACKLSIKSNEKYCGGCYSLGNLYLNKNAPKKALYYFSMDCSKDCCEACFEIEDMYKRRLISEKDFSNIRNKNKTTIETCNFMKKISDNRSNIEEED